MRSNDLSPHILNNPNRRWPGHYEEWICRDQKNRRVKDITKSHGWGEGHYLCTNGSPKTISGMEPKPSGDPSEFDVLTYISPYIPF